VASTAAFAIARWKDDEERWAMSGRFDDRTVFITGAARGQGRSHAAAFAREGANLALSDICADIGTVPYRLGRDSDLAQTVRLCEAAGASVLSARVDVRDYQQVSGFADRTLEAFGQIDVLVANAGIFTFGKLTEMPAPQFDDMIDTNLKGVWHAVKAVVPAMEKRRYGRVVIIGSAGSVIGYPNVGHYCAAKHAVLGMTKSLALEQAANGITVTCVCPTSVNTTMIDNEAAFAMLSPHDPSREGALTVLRSMNALGVPWIEPADVTSIVLYLASEEARYITGVEIKVDLGQSAS
jgi:SDR family mycofactocin-dependent oxidoreductase